MLLDSRYGGGLSLDGICQLSAIQPISGSAVGGGGESEVSLCIPVRGMEAYVIGHQCGGTILQSMMQRSGAKMRVRRNGELCITGTAAGVEHARVLVEKRIESRGLGRG